MKETLLALALVVLGTGTLYAETVFDHVEDIRNIRQQIPLELTYRQTSVYDAPDEAALMQSLEEKTATIEDEHLRAREIMRLRRVHEYDLNQQSTGGWVRNTTAYYVKLSGPVNPMTGQFQYNNFNACNYLKTPSRRFHTILNTGTVFFNEQRIEMDSLMVEALFPPVSLRGSFLSAQSNAGEGELWYTEIEKSDFDGFTNELATQFYQLKTRSPSYVSTDDEGNALELVYPDETGGVHKRITWGMYKTLEGFPFPIPHSFEWDGPSQSKRRGQRETRTYDFIAIKANKALLTTTFAQIFNQSITYAFVVRER